MLIYCISYTILHSPGSLIAWANDVGVKLYDCETGERLTWIERPRGAPPPDQYRCTLCWQVCVRSIWGKHSLSS